MAKVKVDIGRVPQSRGEYVEGKPYKKDNIVTRYGSAFQCVVDSTTTPPATIDASGRVTLGEGWIFFADASGVADVKNGVAALERDLGQYAELPSVAMTAETTGKYINADGEFVDDADFNIAAIGAVVVGNTYELYMGSADKMKLGVALFVARIKTTTTSGNERIEYVPLFSAMSTDIPTSGYVCFEAMEAYSDVLVCYRADVPEAATLLVRRYGTKASIATQINNLRKKVDLKSFADGYYESMRVGTADNLTSKGDATEEIIMSRRAGGDNQIEDGSASIKGIKGYSVVKNQIQRCYYGDKKNGLTLSPGNDGKVIISGTVSLDFNDTELRLYSITGSKLLANHKYLAINYFTNEAIRELYLYKVVNNLRLFADGVFVANADGNANSYISLKVTAGEKINIEIQPMLIDLTQMFGSGNEPATPDDFAKRLGYSSIDDVPYIPYNEGEIVSSFAEGIKTSSRNIMKGLADMEMLGAYFGFRLQPQNSYCLSLKKRNPLAVTPKGSIGFIWNYDKQASAIWAVNNGAEINLHSVYTPDTNMRGKKVMLGFFPQSICQEFLDTYEIQLEYGTKPTDYVQPQSWVRKWKNTIDKYFHDGLKSVGSVHDEITPTTAVKRIESRAYQSGDESNAAVLTDGKNTLYVLDSPEETTYDELNLTEQVAEGGTEEAIITEGKTSTPLRADIVYPIDAYNTIKANKTNIGTLSSLNTASKTDLVSAINELAGKVAALEATATEVTNVTTE